MKRFIAFSIVSCAGLASYAAPAETLHPYQNYSLHLGGIDGSVYTETIPAGQRLVATLGGGPDSPSVVRLVTTLLTGQSATVSVPRGPGETALEVTFTAQGDGVVASEEQVLIGSIR